MGRAEDLRIIKEANKEALKAVELLTKQQNALQRNDPNHINVALLKSYEAVSLLRDTISDSLDNITINNG